MYDSGFMINSRSCTFLKLFKTAEGVKPVMLCQIKKKNCFSSLLPVLDLPFKLLKLVIKTGSTEQGLGLLNTMIS